MRLMPTSFDPNDPDLRSYLIPIDWKWTSCEDALRHAGAIGVMMRLPLFWQLEVPLRDACVAAGAFIFVSDRNNVPLAAEALRSAEIDCVVTDASDTLAFSGFLREKHREQPDSWFVIHPANAPLISLDRLGDASGAQEVHLFPGLPVLEQCHALRSLKGASFHLCEGFEYVAESQTVAIEGARPMRVRLPFALHEDRTCVCGRAVVSV